MPRVIALPTGNGSNTLRDFKNLLLLNHQSNYLLEVDNIVFALETYGFQINREYKRESLKKLGTDLYELRIKRIRLFVYFDVNDFFVLLHGFIKKTQQTPLKELRLAKEEIRKWKNMKERHS